MNIDVMQTIEKIMKEHAEKVAIEYNGTNYTYMDLDHTTNRIALYLQNMEIFTEDIVAIYMERSWFSVCTTIGIMRSGAAFLPIDKKIPIDRVKKILKISKAKLLITDADLFVGNDIRIVNIEHIFTRETVKGELETVNRDVFTLAYVIFTSGTTGEPKGVMIEHGGFCNHISEKIRLLKLNEESVVAHNASIGFDISIWQIFAPLCCGGKIVIFSESSILLVNRFLRILEEEKVTVLEVVPTYLSIIINEFVKKDTHNSLKYVISTGQELTKALVDKWFSVLPDVPLVNAYGPTEASDDIAHCVITSEDKYEQIPIGTPIENSTFVIRPEENSNDMGELWVRGICVGRGYVGNKEETHKYFGIDENTGERIYKTGDLVSKSIDGNFYYHGRIDNQIKLHGYRIEICEIENCIMHFKYINEVTVVYMKETEQLFVFFTSENKIDVEQLKNYLKERIPHYMIPSNYIRLDELPVDINGKTDVRKLMTMLNNEVHCYSEIEVAVCNLIKDILKLQDLPKDEAWKNDLTILGMESIAAIQLIVSIEEEFDLEFEEEYLQPEIIFNFHEICSCIHTRKEDN